MKRTVIVDENAGPGSPVWEQFQRTVREPSADYLYIKDTHPGIPDVEILDKLLSAETLLLTGDCVLHCQAIERGFRSYTLNEQGQLTRRRLAGVVLSPLPQSVHRELLSDYRYQPTSDLPQRLKAGLTEKQLKKCRTARRRIRSHFGSADAICQVSVTIGSKQTERGGLLCGFVLQVAGYSGVAGLRASEGYCLSIDGLVDAACPAIHALRDLYLLQLDRYPIEFFVLSAAGVNSQSTYELCCGLTAATEPLEMSESTRTLRETLRRMIHGISRLTVHPCVKGRFFDAMSRKLAQLAQGRSNEVTTVDFIHLADSVLAAEVP